MKHHRGLYPHSVLLKELRHHYRELGKKLLQGRGFRSEAGHVLAFRYPHPSFPIPRGPYLEDAHIRRIPHGRGYNRGMGESVPEACLREEAWELLWRAVEVLAPEVLKDLRGLVPHYREARPALDRFAVWSWRSLERAAPHAHLAGEAGQALLRLREKLRAWAGRWGLSGPEEPLDTALQALSLWSVDPGLPFNFGRVRVYDKAGPILVIPPFDPTMEAWGDFEARARERFEEWLRAYREWARVRPGRPELENHARWLALRIKGLRYEAIADTMMAPLGEDAVRRGVERLAKLLGLKL